MKKKAGFTVVELLMVVAMISILVAAFLPYVWNGVKLANCDFESPYKCEAIHGIGVVVPPSSIITVWFEDDSK